MNIPIENENQLKVTCKVIVLIFPVLNPLLLLRKEIVSVIDYVFDFDLELENIPEKELEIIDDQEVERRTGSHRFDFGCGR